MDLDFTSPDADKSAFNFGIEYLKTLMQIERYLIISFLKNDYNSIHNGLESMWMLASEWMKDDDEKEQNKIRENECKTHDIVIKAIRNKQKLIPKECIENYRKRYMAITKLLHKKGLRMPRKDDPAFALSGRNY